MHGCTFLAETAFSDIGRSGAVAFFIHRNKKGSEHSSEHSAELFGWKVECAFCGWSPRSQIYSDQGQISRNIRNISENEFPHKQISVYVIFFYLDCISALLETEEFGAIAVGRGSYKSLFFF